MKTNQEFFSILFDEGEHTCFTKMPKGTGIYPVSSHKTMLNWAQYFSINAIHSEKDLNPTQEYHDESKPRRADSNVVSYRNFLIEMDSCDIASQRAFVDEIGLPYSVATFSGGKSIHFIISLSDPCESEAEYRILVARLYRAIDHRREGMIDKANKNPSRLSRFPNVIREDKGIKQELLDVRSRISKETLTSWINAIIPEDSKVVPLYGRPTQRSLIGEKMNLSSWTKTVLLVGLVPGSRNTQVYRLACDFCNSNYSQDEAFEYIARATDLEETEIKSTIRSAYNRFVNVK